MDGPVTGVALPATYRHIDITWVDLNSKANTANTFGRNQSAAGSEKTVEDNVATSRAVEKGVGHKCDRLDGRVQGKKIALVTLLRKSTDARVFPDVGSVASKSSQHHIVAMWSIVVLEHEDQLMAGAIE